MWDLKAAPDKWISFLGRHIQNSWGVSMWLLSPRRRCVWRLCAFSGVVLCSLHYVSLGKPSSSPASLPVFRPDGWEPTPEWISNDHRNSPRLEVLLSDWVMTPGVNNPEKQIKKLLWLRVLSSLFWDLWGLGFEFLLIYIYKPYIYGKPVNK
jgi:hypothetical protein